MYKATYPTEYMCFFPMEMPTKDKGDVLAFFALDVFSEFLIMTGFETTHSIEAVLKNIEQLTKNKDFKKHAGKPFTLVVPDFYQGFIEEILEIISPINGKVVADQEFVAKKMGIAMEQVLKNK